MNTSQFDLLKISDAKLFRIDQPLELPWYNSKTKYKLGKLSIAFFKLHPKDKEKECVCRLLDLDRISSYTLESFENRMKNLLSISEAEKFWLKPTAFYIDEKLRVSLFYKKSTSLYQLLHSDIQADSNFNRILRNESEGTLVRIKYEIAL